MNIEQIRADTPGCEHVTHLNNAGASLMPDRVFKTVTGYLEEELLNGGYETAAKHASDIEGTYRHIARFINARPDEIALLENATAAWNMAFFSISFNKGDRILTSVSEYASNYLGYLRLKEEVDVSIEIIPNDRFGQSSPEALSDMLDDRVKLVSITHIPTNSGLVNPAAEIGTVIKDHPCLYLLDACQSIGHYPVDVSAIGCDMLSATGRKYLRGPRGTGFLYVSGEVLERLHPPFIDLHSATWTDQNTYKLRTDAKRFENWESNYAGILGLSDAVQYADKLGIDNIWQRIQYLGRYLRKNLKEIPGLKLHDIGQTQCGIVTFTGNSTSPSHIKKYLSSNGINVNTSPSNATLIDMKRHNLDELVRVSVHYYNTEEEIELLCQNLRDFL